MNLKQYIKENNKLIDNKMDNNPFCYAIIALKLKEGLDEKVIAKDSKIQKALKYIHKNTETWGISELFKQFPPTTVMEEINNGLSLADFYRDVTKTYCNNKKLKFSETFEKLKAIEGILGCKELAAIGCGSSSSEEAGVTKGNGIDFSGIDLSKFV